MTEHKDRFKTPVSSDKFRDNYDDIAWENTVFDAQKEIFNCPHKLDIPVPIWGLCVNADFVPTACLTSAPGYCARADELRNRLNTKS